MIPDWPTLLHLYSRFKAGKTVRDWMEEYDVYKLGIDVRRFTSFGVIKVLSSQMYFRTEILIFCSGVSAKGTPVADSA